MCFICFIYSLEKYLICYPNHYFIDEEANLERLVILSWNDPGFTCFTTSKIHILPWVATKSELWASKLHHTDNFSLLHLGVL
jgi:hypothetical protein